jgi:hypothetical protein
MTFLNTSNAGIAYIWNFGDNSPVWNGHDATHAYLAPGNYQVSLIALGVGACADTAFSGMVQVGDTAVVAFRTAPEHPAMLSLPNAEVQFINTSYNAAELVWDFGDGITSDEWSPTHAYRQPGTYYVRLQGRSADDCPGRFIAGPFVVKTPELFIPNVFSPNGDGLNDAFFPEYTGDQAYRMGCTTTLSALATTAIRVKSPWCGSRPRSDRGFVLPCCIGPLRNDLSRLYCQQRNAHEPLDTLFGTLLDAVCGLRQAGEWTI